MRTWGGYDEYLPSATFDVDSDDEGGKEGGREGREGREGGGRGGGGGRRRERAAGNKEQKIEG